MKKVLIILCAVFLLSTIVFAQEAENTTPPPRRTWLGFKAGLGPTDITRPDNSSLNGRGGVNVGGLFALNVNHFFADFFGVTFGIGITSFSYVIDQTKPATDDNKSTYSMFEVSLGPIIKAGSFVVFAAPFAGFKIRSTMYNDENAKNLLFGFTAGIGIHLNFKGKLILPITLDFKMSLTEPSFVWANSRLWGLYVTVGLMFGLKG